MGGPTLAREVPRFTGRAEGALDDKGRLVVPSRFRERLGERFVLSISETDPCLVLYPMSTWEGVCERIDALADKKRFRNFVRFLYASSEESSLDGQGRLLIPAGLKSYAGLEREAVSIGANSRIEVWAKSRLAESGPSADEADAFATELGLY